MRSPLCNDANYRSYIKTIPTRSSPPAWWSPGERAAAATLNVERRFTLETRLPPGPDRFLQGEKPQFLVWRAASQCWVPASSGSCHSDCQQVPIPGTGGPDPRMGPHSIMEVRDAWGKPPTGVWLSLERDLELREGTVAAGSHSQQMETYHTLCRLTQHQLLGSDVGVFLSSLHF